MTLTPIESKALILFKEHIKDWGHDAIPEDISGHSHIYITKAQAAAALISLARKGLVTRKRCKCGQDGGWGSAYTLPAA